MMSLGKVLSISRRTTQAPSAFPARRIKPEATRCNGPDGKGSIVQRTEFFKEIHRPESNENTGATNHTSAAESKRSPSSQPLTTRTLQIEEDGDPRRNKSKAKIRLKGKWLERAGFKPGNRVRLAFIAEGVLELRSYAPDLPEPKKNTHLVPF